MFPALLKELREKAGLTQGRIAEILDTPVRTYGSWERGERQPDFDTLIKIADYYHVSTDYLLGRVPMEIKLIKENAPPIGEDEYEIVIEPDDPVPSTDDLERRIAEIVQRELEKKGL